MKCDFRNGTLAESNSCVNICCLMDAFNYNWKLIEVECEHLLKWFMVVMLCEWHSIKWCVQYIRQHSHFVEMSSFQRTTTQHPFLLTCEAAIVTPRSIQFTWVYSVYCWIFAESAYKCDIILNPCTQNYTHKHTHTNTHEIQRMKLNMTLNWDTGISTTVPSDSVENGLNELRFGDFHIEIYPIVFDESVLKPI